MRVEQKCLLIRADANTQLGTGHLMRSLAVAQAWQALGGQAIFMTVCDHDRLLERLRGEAFPVLELEETQPGQWSATLRMLGAYPDAWVLLDGYHFGPMYQQRIREAGHPLVVVDDTAHVDHYYADIVVNQNIYARELNYACEPDTRLVLGARYALLRREFCAWRSWRREIPPVARKVIVTLGGSDPHNLTLRAINALQQMQLDGLEAVVIAGASNPHFDLLEDAVQTSPTMQLVRNATNMPKLMAWADMAVSAGGSTCWELAFMGLPAVVMVSAKNQRRVAESLAASQTVRNLGWHSTVSASMLSDALYDLAHSKDGRSLMSRQGRELIDGKGSERVVNEMICDSTLRVRSARMGDMRRVFEWANDRLTRQMSFHSDPIPWKTHQAWFNRVIGDPKTRLMIVESHKEGRDTWCPIGQVRVDADGSVSISLDPAFRGRGLSLCALQKAIQYFQREWGGKRSLKAYIKPNNRASRTIFTEAGFEFVSEAVVANQSCLEYADGSEG